MIEFTKDESNHFEHILFMQLLHCTLRMYQYYESMQKKIPKALLELLHLKLRDSYGDKLL